MRLVLYLPIYVYSIINTLARAYTCCVCAGSFFLLTHIFFSPFVSSGISSGVGVFFALLIIALVVSMIGVAIWRWRRG